MSSRFLPLSRNLFLNVYSRNFKFPIILLECVACSYKIYLRPAALFETLSVGEGGVIVGPRRVLRISNLRFYHRMKLFCQCLFRMIQSRK